ncbi:MAG: 6-carboxytetrahydropterin synthase QueD, partial [Phycisphaerae bacterium]|nr:6-carboxytetrahydropterin synthase [candidate division KSB1 bacterium]NIV00968.1 6-carboxytetrahydropterin synthase QueD [Phycisphaerae bacterium]NIS24877.1 6-carboxytetrahydropterin synthase [candidate division KSB1 bacterium]NIT71777.1 6-carboxytetrahydropterin synthase [candidate division KSB1 bacterium]NIU25517.1 6-carboxytetrahydropterin synthase [candidate division KSB1 bacterium]
QLEVTVCGPVQKSGPEEGMVMDFGKLSDLVKREIIEMWDHTYLNDVVSFTPTAENLANEILRRLQEKGLSVQRIELWETKKSRAIV